MASSRALTTSIWRAITTPGKLQRHFRNDTEVPFSYIKDIDFPTMAKFAEHDVGLPGVDLAIKPVRSYVYGALGGPCSRLRRCTG